MVSKSEKTVWQEFVALIRKNFYNLIDWLKISLDDKWYAIVWQALYKVPIMLVIVFISPLALVALFFAFIIIV